jgi:hypothetical protein
MPNDPENPKQDGSESKRMRFEHEDDVPGSGAQQQSGGGGKQPQQQPAPKDAPKG